MRWLADRVRRWIPLARIERGCSTLLRGDFQFVVTEGGGCAVDIDNEHDYDVAAARYEEWRKEQLARVEQLYGPLPLPASRRSGVARVSDAAARAARVRRGAGWFALPERGVSRCAAPTACAGPTAWSRTTWRGSRRVPERSGCHALLLTAQGRIVADLHVLAREDELWLELARDALPEVVERLERYVIADDVALSDASDGWRRFALEGPRAPELLARAAGAPLAIARDSGAELSIAGAPVDRVRVGVERRRPPISSSCPRRRRTSVARGDRRGCARRDLEAGDGEVLEVLRIEAGTPRQGRELGEDVLPAEAGLVGTRREPRQGLLHRARRSSRAWSRAAARAIAWSGCASTRGSRRAPPLAGAPVRIAAGQAIGSVTSACRRRWRARSRSPIVRRAHAEPGTAVEVAVRARAHRARVSVRCAFVPPR